MKPLPSTLGRSLLVGVDKSHPEETTRHEDSTGVREDGEAPHGGDKKAHPKMVGRSLSTFRHQDRKVERQRHTSIK